MREQGTQHKILCRIWQTPAPTRSPGTAATSRTARDTERSICSRAPPDRLRQTGGLDNLRPRIRHADVWQDKVRRPAPGAVLLLTRHHALDPYHAWT